MAGRVYGAITDDATDTTITTAAVSAPPYSVVMVNGVYYFVTPGASVVNVTASAPNYTPQTKVATVSDGAMAHVPFALVHV